MRLQTVDVGDVEVAVRRHGEEGVPLLFWHSLSAAGSGAFLDVAAPPLVRAGVQTIALDAPGYGRSAPVAMEEYAVDRLAAWLWRVADVLELERPILAGHSWGGAIAALAAAARPDDVRALVLLDSGHVDYGDWPGAEPDVPYEQLLGEARAEQDEVTSWADVERELTANDLDRPWTLAAWREGVVEEGGACRLRASAEARASASYWLMRARPSDAWPALAAAGLPTLVLLSTEPEQVREANERLVARFEEAVPDADVERVPGMRHSVFPDLGERAGELVADWLRRRGVV